MTNLIFDNKNNVAGILRKFFFVPIEDVASETQAEVILKEEKLWLTGIATKFTLRYRERSRRTRYGALTTATFSGEIPKISDLLEDAMYKMLGRQFLLVFKDHNGNLKKVGTVQQPVTFEYSLSPGSRPGNTSGIEFEFGGTFTRRIFHFSGDLITSGGNDNPPDDGGSGAPVILKWGDDIIAVAQPGEIVTIISEFQAQEIQIL